MRCEDRRKQEIGRKKRKGRRTYEDEEKEQEVMDARKGIEKRRGGLVVVRGREGTGTG